MAIRDLYQTYRRAAAALIERMPQVAAALGKREEFERGAGWRALTSKPQQIVEKEGKPLLVATLYGPSGAGKSTIFRGMTGLNVPAGDRVRPCTHACCVAVPREVISERVVETLFEGWDCEVLTDMEKLRDRTSSKGRLFYRAYERGGEGNHVWLVLADTPDFNCVEVANWERAERMAARAEMVIYVVSAEGYCDARVFEWLRRCCRLAGELVYVITKTTAVAAQEIWADVVRRTGEELSTWQEERADGETLAGFLARARVYWSPWQPDGVRVEDFHALREGMPRFEELLQGEGAVRVLLSNMVSTMKEGVEECERMVTEAAERRAELKRRIERVEELVRDAARKIAGSEFPLGRLLGITLEEIRAAQPVLIRVLRPVTWLVKKAAKVVVKLVEHLKKKKGALRSREELEQERMMIYAEELGLRLRAEFQDENMAGKALSQRRCEEARAILKEHGVPASGTSWEEHVRRAVRQWIKEHPWRVGVYGALWELAIAVGGALIVVDLCVDGGVFAGMGLLAAAGAGSALAGSIVELFDWFEIKEVLKVADEQWQQERTGQFVEHIRAWYAEPLIVEQYRGELERLNGAGIEPCEEACKALREIMHEMRRDACTKN